MPYVLQDSYPESNRPRLQGVDLACFENRIGVPVNNWIGIAFGIGFPFRETRPNQVPKANPKLKRFSQSADGFIKGSSERLILSGSHRLTPQVWLELGGREFGVKYSSARAHRTGKVVQ